MRDSPQTRVPGGVCPRKCVGMDERQRYALNQRCSSCFSDCLSTVAPAPPPGILDGVPDEIRRQLPDEVVDELLAGTSPTPAGTRGPRSVSI